MITAVRDTGKGNTADSIPLARIVFMILVTASSRRFFSGCASLRQV